MPSLWTWSEPKAEADSTGFPPFPSRLASQEGVTPRPSGHRMRSHTFDRKGQQPASTNGAPISATIQTALSSQIKQDTSQWRFWGSDRPHCLADWVSRLPSLFQTPKQINTCSVVIQNCVSVCVCFRASVQAHDCQLNIYQTPADLREGSIIHWLSEHQYQLFLKGSFSSWSVEPI